MSLQQRAAAPVGCFLVATMASITTDQAKVVTSLSKGQGKRKLHQFLKWKPINEDDDLRQSVLLDYHYDMLMFTTQKGLPWQQVCAAVKLASEIQQLTQGVSLPDAIIIYRQKAMEYSSIFGETNTKLITDYFFNTYMKHFKLYQFVVTQPREKQTPCVEVDVHLCHPPEKLSSGIVNNVWEYQQKFKEIEQKETEQCEAKEERSKNKKDTLDDLVDKSVQESDPEIHVDREEFIKIMKEVLNNHISAVAEDLGNIIDDTRDELDIKLEKVALPRPAELGQPPRFQTKTPIQVNTDKGKSTNRRPSGKSAGGKKSSAK